MSLIAVLSALLFVILDVCMPKAVSIGILFVIRAFASGMFSIVYLYTNEVSPVVLNLIAHIIVINLHRENI